MAESYLVDTSVFVRWYLQQDGHEDAVALRAAFAAGAVDLETVDFVRFERGHVLRTHGLLKNLLTEDEYIAAARSLDDAGILVHVTSADVLEQAAVLAARRMLRFYDALLIAWSLELGLTVLTADYAVRVGARGVVLAHNHAVRSGPSRADEAAARRLVAAGRVLGVPLIAHLVVEPGAVHELVGLVAMPVDVPC